MMGMTKQAVMTTRYGEMMDLIACFSIYNGAKEKKYRRAMSFDEAMALR